MLYELLSSVPLIIITVMILLKTIRTIYRLFNHKRIFDSTDEISVHFYIFPFAIMLFMVFDCVSWWRIITAVLQISTFIFTLIIVSVKRNGITEPFSSHNKSICDKIIMIIVMMISYSLIYWLKSR